MGFMTPLDGYGYGTQKIAQRLPADWWEVVDMRLPAGATDPAAAAVDERVWWLDGDVVALCQPDWLPNIDAGGGLISYTMFEATGLPAGWANKINRYCRALIVPCAWNAEVFRDNGVLIPIHVVKWGVDPVDYPLVDGRAGRTQRCYATASAPTDPPLQVRPYTFLWSGTPDKRKGYDLAYRCFFQAFGHNPNVRLVLHFRKRPIGVNGVLDPNVRMVTGMFDLPTLRSMLRRADAFVFPSRGEGWGLPPREAAATGLPVIATNYGGLAEDIHEWALPLRVAGASQADFAQYEWGEVGEWAEPDPEHLVELYRWCYENQDEAAAFGQTAAGWLAENAGWERTARGVANVLGYMW
jgi:glycosyltransferase involved in cell wall biosynthesis